MPRRKLSDFQAEIESHIALEAARLREEGLSAQDALESARRKFGNTLATEERFYEATHAWRLEHFWQDVRYAARLLARNPTFAAAAILTLALGIGANTAIFTAVDALALRPLPFADPQQLAAIETHKQDQPEVESWTSTLDFTDIQAHTRSFTAVAALSPVWNSIMTGRDAAERLETLYVSSSFFPMLDVHAIAGRDFTAADDRLNARSVVMLSYELWSKRFGADRSIVGQSLSLDGASYTVIGVLPRGFLYPGEPLAGKSGNIDAWIPLAANPLYSSARSLRFLKIAARLKPGVTAQQANADVARISHALAAQYPDTNRNYAISVRPLAEQVAGDIRPMSWLLLGAVVLVLAMACASVANLLLVRAAARQREIFVRVALGASRARLLAQLLSEGLLLSALGGAAGIALAYFGLQVLVALAPAGLVSHRAIALDWRAMLFTIVAVLGSALLASLPPALALLRPQANAALGAGLRRVANSVTGGNHRARAALVAAQIACALMLLIGAGLLLRSFGRLLNVQPGFDTAHIATMSTQLPRSAQTADQRAALYHVIEQRLREVPGVVSVAAVSRLPLSGMALGSWLWVEGQIQNGDRHPEVEYRVATSNYFSTMGIPLIAGRLYDERTSGELVCLINETLAKSFFPAGDPVGKRVKFGPNTPDAPWVTIVGVVGDVRHFGIESAAHPEAYRPAARSPLGSPNLVIRVGGDPKPLLPALSAAVRGVNPEMPAYNVFSMDELARRSTAQRRFVLSLLAAFAAAALLLASVGIYGAAAQLVAQRTREIGLRMALGASPAAAQRLVLRMGALLAAAGVAAGVLGALGLSRWMRGLLYQVSPLDPVVFVAAAFLLGMVALAACWGPARRASRIAPMVALREE